MPHPASEIEDARDPWRAPLLGEIDARAGKIVARFAAQRNAARTCGFVIVDVLVEQRVAHDGRDPLERPEWASWPPHRSTIFCSTPYAIDNTEIWRRKTATIGRDQ